MRPLFYLGIPFRLQYDHHPFLWLRLALCSPFNANDRTTPRERCSIIRIPCPLVMSLSEEHGRGDSCGRPMVSGPVRTVSQRLDVENILDGILLTIASLHQAATLDESSSITAAIPATVAKPQPLPPASTRGATCNDARPAYRNFNRQSSSIHHCS